MPKENTIMISHVMILMCPYFSEGFIIGHMFSGTIRTKMRPGPFIFAMQIPLLYVLYLLFVAHAVYEPSTYEFLCGKKWGEVTS
jgi:hypothetical protein